MRKKFIAIESIAFLVSTTLGAGIFALPFVFNEAGWVVSLVYMLVTAAALVFAHWLYWEALSKTHDSDRFVGLAKKYLGKASFWPASFAIAGGLVLALLIYLILADNFINMIVPVGPGAGALLFWFAASILLVFRLKWFAALEFIGSIVLALFILLFFGMHPDTFAAAPAANWPSFFLPFGAILFALAGWPALEPIFSLEKRTGLRKKPLLVIVSGTLICVALYLLFVLGVFGSGAPITQDTLSGFAFSPVFLALAGIFGIFLIWTSYVPMGFEIMNTLEKDLGQPPATSFGIVTLTPLALYFLGLNSFVTVISLAGGIFLALQYVFILLVAIRALALKGVKRFLAQATAALFVLGIVYEIWYFVIR